MEMEKLFQSHSNIYLGDIRNEVKLVCFRDLPVLCKWSQTNGRKLYDKTEKLRDLLRITRQKITQNST